MSDGSKTATIAPWQVIDSKYNYRDRWLALRSDTVRLPNGRVLAPYHVVEQPDWVTAVALTPDGKIVLVEEYRHGARQTVIELPSGIHDKPGEPLAAIKRELLEETGFSSDEWTSLGSFFANAPRLFLADLQAGRRTLHGFQGGVMWLLANHARRSADPRLAAFLA
jgi:8-oxo-dGTP pyrophosphatase MutT (NUDIX family)